MSDCAPLEEKIENSFPSYAITLDHLPLKQRAEYLKRNGVTNREERRRIIESSEERSKLFVLPSKERGWYHALHHQQKQRTRDEDDENYAQFYKLFFKSFIIGGLAMSVYSGELEYIPISLAVGAGVPLAFHIGRSFFEWLDADREVYD